ncbi:MAG: hypothetical protein ACOY5C_13880 [Pseudomonadota bacterium]|uniref:hypothetical protein n=1 Tax=Thermithiobacillus tepidarius TaxID=929 RepID=UPI0004919E1F|nr:hypothetical protein [Thermithiobacillus tepidarius]
MSTTDPLQQAIKCLAIQDVYLRNTAVELVGDFDPLLAQQELLVQFKFRPKAFETLDVGPSSGEDTLKMLRVVLEAGMRFIDPAFESAGDGEKEPAEKYIRAIISAEFVADYQILCPDLPHEAFEAFAKKNAGFHMWPYWREYAQSMCARMRLPQVMFPMYQVPA